MPRKLKVFRTPIGFHDAYVAAPSQKAALEAWGADASLFARGSAEQVTDPKLTAQPLAHPGKVIKVSRGDLRAQLKALELRRTPSSKTKPADVAKPKPAAKPKRQPKPKPPPKRDRIDRAEATLAAAREKQAKERAALDKQREALERKVEALMARQAKEIARLETRLDKAQAAYRDALNKWSG